MIFFEIFLTGIRKFNVHIEKYTLYLNINYLF